MQDPSSIVASLSKLIAVGSVQPKQSFSPKQTPHSSISALLPSHTPHSSSSDEPPHSPLQSISTIQFPSQS